MTKQKPWQAFSDSAAELLREIRGWLGHTQEQLAVALNCTHRTYWLWETGAVYPGEEIWGKLLELVKREARKRFRSDYLEHLCGAAGLTPHVDKGNNQFRLKTEKEMLTELKANTEYVNFWMNNIFAKKFPELKNLPFRTAFAKYCRDEIDIIPRTLLNRFPVPADVRKIRDDRRKRIPKTTPCSFNRNKIISIRLKESKRQKRRRSEKTTSDSGGNEGSDGGPEPPGLGFAIPEARVKEFIDLFRRKYGIELEEKEAYQRFSGLLILFTILLQEAEK